MAESANFDLQAFASRFAAVVPMPPGSHEKRVNIVSMFPMTFSPVRFMKKAFNNVGTFPALEERAVVHSSMNFVPLTLAYGSRRDPHCFRQDFTVGCPAVCCTHGHFCNDIKEDILLACASAGHAAICEHVKSKRPMCAIVHLPGPVSPESHMHHYQMLEGYEMETLFLDAGTFGLPSTEPSWLIFASRGKKLPRLLEVQSALRSQITFKAHSILATADSRAAWDARLAVEACRKRKRTREDEPSDAGAEASAARKYITKFLKQCQDNRQFPPDKCVEETDIICVDTGCTDLISEQAQVRLNVRGTVLSMWMDAKAVTTGFIDAGVSKGRVHLDGTCPIGTCIVFQSGVGRRVLTPYDIISVKGYPSNPRLGFVSIADARAATVKAMDMPTAAFAVLIGCHVCL